MKLTIYTKDEKCDELISVNFAHITMFEKNRLTLHFTNNNEMIKLIEILIKEYVLFQIQGTKIEIIPESNNYQRVRFRFDS